MLQEDLRQLACQLKNCVHIPDLFAFVADLTKFPAQLPSPFDPKRGMQKPVVLFAQHSFLFRRAVKSRSSGHRLYVVLAVFAVPQY